MIAAPSNGVNHARAATSAALGLACVLMLVGCVEPWRGSHVQMTLRAVPSPCTVVMAHKLAGSKQCTGDELSDRLLYHYELWGTVRQSGVVQLASFTVQRHVQPDELIQLEARGVKASSGEPIQAAHTRSYASMSAADQQIARSQMEQVASVSAITSFSPRMFQTAAGREDWLEELFYVGGYVQLTFPINGLYYGQVEGKHPFAATQLSGTGLRVSSQLDDLDSMMITIEEGDPDRVPRRPGDHIYLRGVAVRRARGIINVDASSLLDEAAAKFAVYTDFATEDYF